MRYSEIIAEARRRSDVNTPVAVNDWIKKYFNRVQQDGDSVGNSVVLNLFISLTAIPKLGVNPRSHYNTPLGIYAYPVQYVLQKVGDKLPLKKLPFAGDEPWVNIFRVSEDSNVIDLAEVTEDMYNEYCQRFVEILSKRYKNSSLATSNKVVVRFKEEAKTAARVTTPGGRLWYVSMEVSKKLNSLYRGKTNLVTWNKLFRDVGIDGFIDMGKGIIHPSEPTQAVFFSMKPIQVLDRVQNKYSPDTREITQLKGQAKKEEFEQLIKEFRQILATGNIAEIEKWLSEAEFRSTIKPSVWLNNIPANLRAKYLIRNPRGLLGLSKITKSDYFSALVGNPYNVLVYFRGLYDRDVLVSPEHESKGSWTKFLTSQELAQALYQSKNYAKSKMDNYHAQELLRSIKLYASQSGIDLTTPANSVVLKALINLSPGLFRPMLAMYANEGKMLDKDIYEYALTLADGKEKVEITKYWDYFNKQALDIEDMLTQVKS